MVTRLRAGRVAAWLALWEEQVGAPEALLLDPSFAAALAAIVAAYADRPPSASPAAPTSTHWGVQCAVRVRDYFDHADPEVAVYRADAPGDVATLDRLVHATAYDMRQILAVAARLDAGPSRATLQRRLVRELTGQTTGTRGLAAVSRLLARAVVTRHRVSDFDRLAGRAVAHAGAEALFAARLGVLSGDAALTSACWRLVRAALIEGVEPAVLGANRGRMTTTLPDLFPDPAWATQAHRLFRAVADACTRELRRGGRPEVPDQSRLDAVSARAGAAARVGSAVFAPFAEAVLAQAYRVAGRGRMGQCDPAPGALRERLAGELRARLGYDSAGAAAERSVEDVGGAIVESGATAVAPLVLGAIDHPAWDYAAQAFGREIVELLRRTLLARPAAPGADVEGACADWAARRDVQAELADLLVPLAAQLVAAARDWSAAAPVEPPAGWGDVFWRRFARRFAALVALDQGADLLPWDSLPRPTAVVAAVLDDLLGRPRAWTVCMAVRGFDPQGSAWRMGAVMFYDPEAYDFGEGRWLRGELPRGAPTTLARTTVEADTAGAALQRARLHLAYGLDALSFAFSVGRMAGGLRPLVAPAAHVAEADGSRWWQHGEAGRADMASVLVASEPNLAGLATAYAPLVAAVAEARATPVQERLVRAFHNYRHGKWEDEEDRRFVAYWIALEQLFVAGTQQPKHRAAEFAAELLATRRDAFDLVGVLVSRRDIVLALEADLLAPVRLAGVAALAGWSSDESVLLRRSSADALVRRLVPRSGLRAQALAHARAVRRAGRAMSRIDAAIRQRREVHEFRLRACYAMRNRLVHEALPFSPELHVYTIALEEALEEVLRRAVRCAAPGYPGTSEMRDILDWYAVMIG